MKNQEASLVADDQPARSPFERAGEEDVDRIQRLLREGTATQCLIEANYWLEYYLDSENADLEAVSTAMTLNERAQWLIASVETTTVE